MLLMVYLKSIAKYPWCLSNLVSSLWINTFTKIDLMQWLNEPFTPPPETENQLFYNNKGIPLIHEIVSHGAYPLHDYERLYSKKKLLGH